ncbi:thioredoxin family protein [Verrucomicrobiaceae bacterium N1E253]|uniref:Thioredoxin family protein n=1 Tax=Oceaniferula marina TaxID=2748318 RepID=A0A851GGW0_9BACT|nr:thioredoxin family protein [Oceaniferula marina]NWK56132.1 thioredoxin family protein [Oceaniferula marina]
MDKSSARAQGAFPPERDQPEQQSIIMRKTTRLASFVLALTASFAFAGGEGWVTDFEAAKKKAAEEKKDLLVDFTGSDWCGWCIKLNDEVFKHDAFKKGVAEKFVLVELDYPRDKSKLSEETQKQNAKLKETYTIKGYPTILLMDAKGRPYAQTGYQAGGPEAYVTHLDELQAERVKRDENLAKAAKLEGVEKAKALVAVLKELPEDHLSHYSELTGEISKLDPEDQSGFVKAQQLKEAKQKLEASISEAMRGNKADTVPPMIDAFIAEHKLEGEEKQELEFTKLQILVSSAARSGEMDKALKTVDSYITQNKLEGEMKQNVLGVKMGPLLQAKKFDEAAKVIDAIIAVDPNTRAGKFAEQFKPRLEKMKAQAGGNKSDNPPHGEPGHVHEEGE